MVLYHWLNYFIGLEWDGYRYLRFLTPSFIFLSGYLVSRVYLAKYADQPTTLRRRLVQRGLKTLLLFAALNVADTAVAVHSVSPAAIAGAWPLDRLALVLTTGDGGAAFAILLPIGYFLCLAPFVVSASAALGVAVEWIAAIGLAGAVAMTAFGIDNSVVEMLAIGLLGMAIGHGRVVDPGALDRHPLLLGLGYVAYIAAIRALHVPFWLQAVGVCLTLAGLHLVLGTWRQPALVKQHVAELGRYSLFAYVAQIAILQALKHGLPGAAGTPVGLAVALVLAVIMTSAAVVLAGQLRSAFAAADRAYRFVFA